MTLNTNKELLNNQFETYRVSLKKLESVTTDLNCELFDWNDRKSSDCFSQIKAFGSHNNIILDEYNTNNIYFITKDLLIYRTTLHKELFNLSEAEIVFQSRVTLSSVSKRSPPLLFFPSSNIACFYDGIETLNILLTGKRCMSGTGDNREPWKLLCCTSIDTSSCDATLLECRIERIETEKHDSDFALTGELLHCCFMRILDKKIDKNVELVWTKYKYCQESAQLSVIENKVWRGETPPEMVTFTGDFKSLEMVGDHSFRYIPSGITIDSISTDNIKSLANWWQNTNNFFSVQYYLNMAAEDFTLNIEYPTEDNEDVVISLVIKDKEPLVLERKQLNCNIDKDSTKWFVENEMLIVKLKKQESEETEDVVAKRCRVLFDQVEDVDNCEDCDLGLMSFDGSTGQCVEEISLSVNQWLFKTRLAAGAPLTACLRYNVDGLLWTKDVSGSPWTHRHTLNAFGYVSAAKVDRKFMVCSLPVAGECPGVKFAVLSDWKRSLCVFMQCRPLGDDMAVKNRSTGRVVTDIADEYFMTMESSQEIMGLVATATACLVLYRTTEGRLRITAVNCL